MFLPILEIAIITPPQLGGWDALCVGKIDHKAKIKLPIFRLLRLRLKTGCHLNIGYP